MPVSMRWLPSTRIAWIVPCEEALRCAASAAARAAGLPGRGAGAGARGRVGAAGATAPAGGTGPAIWAAATPGAVTGSRQAVASSAARLTDKLFPPSESRGRAADRAGGQ